jgi:hypothetical protein
MFIIVQNIMQEAHEDVEVFDRFDILTSASGFPIKFNTRGSCKIFRRSWYVHA